MMSWMEKQTEANGEWKLKQTEFYGYVKAKLDDIHEDIHDLKEENKCLQGRVNELEKVDAAQQEYIDNMKSDARTKGFHGGLGGASLVTIIVGVIAAVLRGMGLI